MNITPKNIIQRHAEFPDATEQLIEAYAFAEYKKAIADLMRFAQVVNVENTNTTLIVLSNYDYKQWKDLELSHWYLNK
jgi:hypothetical protein